MELKNFDNMGKITFIMLGRSGCGKGTQVRFIMRHFRKKLVHIETGKVLRKLLKRKNETSIRARRILKAGKLVPSWLAAFAWLTELFERDHINTSIIFDGTPRTLWEAILLDEVMRWHGRVLPVCLYFDVREEEAVRRLLHRGRADDTVSAIKNRMKFFKKDVLPVIRYYQSQERMVRIDANPAPDVIAGMIMKKLIGRFGRRVWR